ncbi:PX domain protein [Aspergillus bombycis]|uniref:PX domain protein n=1 Tax=Aspergillus bombycis TaxID=109264 RepID=A0A1F7ZJR7_9EURO|nr:PX domain protein [Aspergillus bombycis]OGM39549.1 PX domain protein [Aspergillus bombycis]
MDTPDVAPSQPNETNLPDQASVAEQQANANNHGTNIAELVGFVIGFLSTASNEVLLGVFAGLVSATYILLGRLGLLLIGVASGIALHASWEGTSTHSSKNELHCRLLKRRREMGLDIAHRLLDWSKRNTTRIKSNDNLQELSNDVVEIEPDYTSFRPKTAAALESLTDAVIKDYVK